MQLDRSTIWPYVEGEPGDFYYARYDHPAGVEAERALGELDGGRALLYSSGTAAAAAVVFALLEPGQTIAVPAGAYYGTPVLFRELERWGLRHVQFDQTGPPPDAELEGLETAQKKPPSIRGGDRPSDAAQALEPSEVFVGAAHERA